ncbi:MAG: T9SS type A sorting domain-containing protein [Bacteroidetes bacterium]|nr:T9SS type A sorting domain-containing protein [Bacteroidota bacterium]
MASHAQWTSLGPAGGNVTAVAERNGIFYAALDPGGVYESTDHMQSWHSFNMNMPRRRGITIEHVPCGDILLTTDRGVFRLSDAQEWVEADDSVFGPAVITTIDVMTESICMAGGQQGEVFRSDDGGRTWSPLASFTPKPTPITDFYTPTTGPWLCAAGTLYSSADSGRTWQLHEQFGSVATTATRIAAIDLPVMTSIGVAGKGLAKSTNNGITFSAPPNGATYTDMLFMKDGVLYSAGDQGVSFIRPNKQEWTGLHVNTNRLFRSSRDSLYALTQKSGLHVFQEPVSWYSNDNGAWSSRSEGLHYTVIRSCWTLQGGRIIVTTDAGMPRRLDRVGATYADSLLAYGSLQISSMSQTASGQIVALAAAGNSPLDLYFSNDNGLTFASHYFFGDYDIRYDSKPEPATAVCYHPTDSTKISAVVKSTLIDVTVYPTIHVDSVGPIDHTYSMIHTGDFILAQTDQTIIKHAVGTKEQRTTLQGSFSKIAPMVKTDKGVVYVVGTTALYCSLDSGEQWTLLPLPALRHRPLYCVTGPHGVVAMGSDSEVVLTLDSGRTWQNYGTGLPDARITSIAIDDSDHLIVGTDGYGVLVRNIDITTSVDGKVSMEAGHQLSVRVHPNPTSEQFTATVTFGQSTSLQWRLLSITGSIVAAWTSDHDAGTTSHESLIPPVVGSGIYILTCTTRDQLSSVPLMYVK